MGLFGKKKKEAKSCCSPGAMKQTEPAKCALGIKVLGSGCAKCIALETATREALA